MSRCIWRKAERGVYNNRSIHKKDAITAYLAKKSGNGIICMKHTQTCPECSMVNPLDRRLCQQCGGLLRPKPRLGEWPEPRALPTRDQSQQHADTQQRFLERPQRVHSSTRRKFLAGLLGSTAILGLSSPALAQLFQNIVVAFNTKNFPKDRYKDLLSMSFAPDLSMMAMFNVREDGLLYIWDYEQQRMTTLPANPRVGLVAWSPNGKYVLCQTGYTDNTSALDMWDVQARRRIRSYADKAYIFNEAYSFYDSYTMRWSPDGSLIALLLQDSFVILDAVKLIPLSTFSVSTQGTNFAWSPDNRKLVLQVEQPEIGSWGLQVWDVRTLKMEREVSFQGGREEHLSTLAWSPAGAHIAILAHGQLHIMQAISTFSSYTLDEPNDSGRLAWSPDGKHLAVAIAGGYSDKLSIWDMVTRNKVHVLNRDLIFTTFNAIAWSKDGGHITAISDLFQQENWYWL